MTSANGFASCARCHAVFLLPKDLAWAPHELAYESDPVSRPRGVDVSRVEAAPHDAYRGIGAAALPVRALTITWRPPRTRWLLALLVPFACVISGFFAAIRPPTSPAAVIAAASAPLAITLGFVAYALAKAKTARPAIEIRSEAGAEARLLVRGEEKVDVEAGAVQSIDVERFEAPLDIRYHGVRVGPRTTGKYAVVARVAGRAVRLASFDWPARAMFVAAELGSALGLDSAPRRRVAVIESDSATDSGADAQAEVELAADTQAEAEAEAEAEMVDEAEAGSPRARSRSLRALRGGSSPR